MKTVAQFDVKFQQYLNEDAKVVQELPEFAKDNNHLLRLYRSMLFTRALDAKAVTLQRQGKMGTYPSSLGQEAIGSGLGDAMLAEDVFCPYYRSTGALLARGVKPSEILSFWGGDERGADYQVPRQDFPISVPIATQCLHAAGVGFAMKYRQQQRAVVTSIGEGGTSEGDFYEALNVAGAWQLPVVFVVNNNQWAISVPRDSQTQAQTIAQKAIAAGFEGIQVDGNDVIAVRDTVDNALKKARQGNGPTLIEAVSYRLSDHTTADDARRYWDQATVDAARKKEPVIRLKHYLIEQGVWNEEQDTQLHAELKTEVNDAVEFYLNTEKDAPESMFDFTYAELPESLIDQRELLGGTHE